MAVSPIKSIGIIGLKSELDKVINICGDSGVFQPDDPTNFYSDTRGFVPVTDKNPYTEPLSDFTETLKMAGIKPQLLDIAVNGNEKQVISRAKALDAELS